MCKGEKVQKWGHQNNKQRYRGTDCCHNFTLTNKAVSQHNQFVWFRKWIMERQVYKTLIRDGGMSQSSIQRLFNHYLSSPPDNVVRSKSHVHLLIDGTYFSNGLCLILYYDKNLQYVQLYRNTDQEKYKEIREDPSNLKKLGVDVYSVTCDGHKATLKSIAKVYPNAIIQRCVVHVKRHSNNWLGKSPKMEPSRQLRQLIGPVTTLNTIEQVNQWLIDFHHWYGQNECFINEQSMNEQTGRMWYTHKNLRAACSHLINAIPHLFSYVNDAEIPKTTNELEGYFTHLKEKLTLHKGLRFEKRKNFIKWYLHFKNQK
ncbi:MAG: transposase [Pseudopedobacter saltans]|uniref:Transposase n=1 Tax=Pseudopedobacter saltans TaxID=151895 RepID=A0A2W5FAV1_9SPHI|nr:MAG: transposase [Pseudopedobacter saltans]